MAVSGSPFGIRLDSMPRHRLVTLASVLLLVSATVLAYSNSFAGRFQIDDQHVIQENLAIRDLGEMVRQLGTSTRSLVNLTFALNYACHGLELWGYHFVNLLVHLAAVLFLFFWLRSIWGEGGSRTALLTALLFGVHPLTTQSVTYITQRYSSMAGMFFFASLWLWSRFRHSGRRFWHVLCLGAVVAGMLCKEMMVAAPLALIAADFALHRTDVVSAVGARAVRRWTALVPLVVLLWIVPVLNLISHGHSIAEWEESLNWAKGLDVTRWAYLLTQIRLIVLTYLQLMVFPVGQSVDHPVLIVQTAADPATVASAAALLLGLILSIHASFVRPDRPARVAGFGGLLFFLGLAATSTIIPNSAIVQEQRLYVSLAGFLTAVTALIWMLPLHRFIPTAVLGAAAVVLGVLTHERNILWHSESVVWQDAVNRAPNSPRAHNNLALALADAGRIDDAVSHLRRAIKLNPNYALAYNNLGNILFRRDRVAEAMQLYAEAIRIAPDYADAHNNMGAALERTGQYAAAVRQCRRALELEPNLADAHNNLGNALEGMNQLDEAVHHFRAAIDLYRRLNETRHQAMAHNNLANTLARLGNHEDAAAHYDEALRLNPQYDDAQRNRALLQRKP